MPVKRRFTMMKVLVVVTFLVMVTINILANILPINGVTTGQVSDSYRNLFAPAGFTFAIWGLIYLLLAGHILYQLGFFRVQKSYYNTGLLDKVGIYFSISSIANTLWIFAWHYHFITLSMLLILAMLTCLVLIVNEIKKEVLSFREYLFIGLPFSVYFGWLTVANIANLVVLLVSWGLSNVGTGQPVWTVIFIAAGLVISLIMTIKNKDLAYGMVIIWAYAGILAKHTSASGFGGQYPLIIAAVVISLVLLLSACGYLLLSGSRR